uniref:Uncharacterized protein n=1 Tax=Rhizophora mucronata TaxID=61149 RepID=A0A2P2PI72_RHIMU
MDFTNPKIKYLSTFLNKTQNHFHTVQCHR